MSTEVALALAVDIEHEHEQAQEAFASAVEHAVRCGELLLEAKAEVGHGEWGAWVDEHFPASRRSAQGYMRLARHGVEAQALAHLGIEGALRELAAPAPDREPLSSEERARLAELEATIEQGRAKTRAAGFSFEDFFACIVGAGPDRSADEIAIAYVNSRLHGTVTATSWQPKPGMTKGEWEADFRVLNAAAGMTRAFSTER